MSNTPAWPAWMTANSALKASLPVEGHCITSILRLDLARKISEVRNLDRGNSNFAGSLYQADERSRPTTREQHSDDSGEGYRDWRQNGDEKRTQHLRIIGPGSGQFQTIFHRRPYIDSCV